MIIVVLLGGMGPLGCQSDPTGDGSEKNQHRDTAVVASNIVKYVAELTELLPRYYDVLGIDYGVDEPPWKTALTNMGSLKLNSGIQTMIETSVASVDKVLGKRFASSSASPSNTLFMPVNLLVGLLRAMTEKTSFRKLCSKNDPCQFPRQVFKRFVLDFRICFNSQKRTQPSTDYYRLYRGLVDYSKLAFNIEEKAARVLAMEFLDTYVLPIYLVNSFPFLTTYRWTTKPDMYYPRDLVVIEEFIASGPPDDSEPDKFRSIDIFRRFYEYAKSFWDNRVIIEKDNPTKSRELYATIKSIVTDIRHTR